jgi:hypothetical protein
MWRRPNLDRKRLLEGDMLGGCVYKISGADASTQRANERGSKRGRDLVEKLLRTNRRLRRHMVRLLAVKT